MLRGWLENSVWCWSIGTTNLFESHISTHILLNCLIFIYYLKISVKFIREAADPGNSVNFLFELKAKISERQNDISVALKIWRILFTVENLMEHIHDQGLTSWHHTYVSAQMLK